MDGGEGRDAPRRTATPCVHLGRRRQHTQNRPRDLSPHRTHHPPPWIPLPCYPGRVRLLPATRVCGITAYCGRTQVRLRERCVYVLPVQRASSGTDFRLDGHRLVISDPLCVPFSMFRS